MRVLVVSHEWEVLTPGGAQRSAGALAAGLARLPGLEVTLASAVREPPEDLPFTPTASSSGYAEVLVQSETDFESFSWIDRDHAGNWERVLAATQPDIVHLHHYYQVGVDLPLVARRVVPAAGIVLTLHEFLAICLQSGQMIDGQGHLCGRSTPAACAACVGWPVERTYARADYLRHGLGAVDAFVTPSAFVRNRYLDWGLAPEAVRVIPNALELNRRDQHDTGRRDEGGLRLAFIGQHTPFKGLDVLMEAVGLLLDGDPDALAGVEVYGGGSERFSDEFHERILGFQTRYAPLVRFRGSYGQEDLPGILDAADAIVVPSIWWENSPVVIEEALARRVPVICSDIGGMAEKVRDGVDGWHFQAGNPAALAELISRLARESSLDLPHMRQPPETSEVIEAHLAVYEDARRAALARGR